MAIALLISKTKLR